jgi:PIN domain nuclease of toxin-antitoxin system
MRLLLDTCTFLWIAGGSPRLSLTAHDHFLRAEEAYLSVVSVWEIAVKHGLGRLPLPEAPYRWVSAQREARGLASLPLDEEAVLHLQKLPLLHQDPFDRLLVFQAVAHGLTILTPDDPIAQYPIRTIW